MKSKLQLGLLLLAFLGLSIAGYPQGVTTAALKGRVVDTKGKPLFAATVLAVHTPTEHSMVLLHLLMDYSISGI